MRSSACSELSHICYAFFIGAQPSGAVVAYREGGILFEPYF